jgi:hypothetical protein
MRDEMDSIAHWLPPFVPVKITSGVDRYGFSSVLASRCGRRVVPRSFANWVHGWMWHEELTAELLACSKLPREVRIVVCNDNERQALVDEGFLDVRIGGLPFAYVQRQHESRHADALLAFPPHSAESEKVTVDQGRYMDYLESLKNDFEAVYVSIYYLDMGGAMHKAALARGLRVIQGARPDDANSLVRMRSILDSFSYVTSNVMGSHMLYALFAGCRFSFCGPIYGYDDICLVGNPHGHTTDYLQQGLYLQSEPYLRKRFGRFFVDNPHMGIEDLPFAEVAIGMRFIMTPDEIEDALGWSIAGQVRGYVSGARRRLARTISSTVSGK